MLFDSAKISLLALILSVTLPVFAQTSGRPGHGLVGFSITMYQPACAHACRSALPRSYIPCDIHLDGHHSSTVSPECLALSEPYLFSAAWCLHTRCSDENVTVSKLEEFWETEMVGRELNQPKTKYTYQESLALVKINPPTTVLAKKATFNQTTLVSDDAYTAAWNGNSAFEHTEIYHQRLSVIILVTGAGIPILLSLLRFIPFPPMLINKFYGFLIEPPVFGKQHASPVMGLGLVPTRGQALFILYIIAINVICVGVGYQPRQPNSWWEHGLWEEVLNYVANRTGMLSFANLPLVFLYAGRNNILLWLTNWSYSTFLLIHRWIAFICVLQAVIHSALWLHIHVGISNDHAEVASIPYWYSGVIGTLALVLMLPFSMLPVRQRMYEFFHASHIIFAILSVVGCWYHIIYRYKRQWGYENWVIMAAVIWAFDWFLRAIRMARNGLKRGYVSRIGTDYIRLDVPGLDCQPGSHAYMHFPSLTWRVWESHPFSAIGFSQMTTVARNSGNASISEPGISDSEKVVGVTNLPASDVQATPSNSPQKGDSSLHPIEPGVSFFIRIERGTTTLLAAQAGRAEGLPLFTECYSGQPSLYGECDGDVTPSYPNLVAVVGGVGITSILPKLSTSQTLFNKPIGRKQLYWGVRHQGLELLEAVRDMIRDTDKDKQETEALVQEFNDSKRMDFRWRDVDVHVLVGERFDIRSVIETELAANNGKGGTVVLTCGPEGMADEVRMVVSAQKRNGAMVKLVEECFSW